METEADGPAGQPGQGPVDVFPYQCAGLFASGLLETLTSNLARSESFSDAKFWVVPAGEILRRAIASPDEARQVFDALLAPTAPAEAPIPTTGNNRLPWSSE